MSSENDSTFDGRVRLCSPNRCTHMLVLWAVLVPAIGIGPSIVADAAVNPGPLAQITSIGNPLLPSDATPALQGEPPQPTGLSQFVRDQRALLRLGKALFWDMQVGTDGAQSCASCHFHGGADNRIKNQVSPGLKVTPLADTTFQLGQGPNYTLKASDFPLSTNQSQNDVVSSQGVMTTDATDANGFNVSGTKVRRVEPRNAPTVINTAFNRFQFWDGRAKDQFNGVTPFGPNPAGAYPTIYRADSPDTSWSTFDVIQDGRLDQSALASIAVGPVLSLFEMSGFTRTFVDLHFTFQSSIQVVENATPLAGQLVDPTDSVLGGVSAYPNTGLTNANYALMIQDAFAPQWWNSTQILDGFTLMEENLSLFWGLAIREYLTTLIADSGLGAHTPFDRYQAGDLTALTPRQVEGLRLFVNSTANGGANCSTCHAIPEFTRASLRRTAEQELLPTNAVPHDLQVKQNGWITDYGVRLPGDDPGAGDPATFPNPPAGNDPTSTQPNTFKVPTLRNIALTAPYMHTGRFSTLEQVVDFYNQGRQDGVTNRGPNLNLTADQQAALVDFLRYGLTDERVLFERPPFDHPQLFVPNGEQGNDVALITDDLGNAIDQVLEIPAVGQLGSPSPISAVNFEVNLGAQSDPYASVVTLSGETNFTYNGQAQGPTQALAIGSTGAISLTYASWDDVTFPSDSRLPTNAGTYSVVATVAADATHPSASSSPLVFKILPAPLTISAQPVVKTYGSSTNLETGNTGFTADGLVNGETIGSVTITASGGTDSQDGVGIYTLTPSDATGGTVVAANYAISYLASTLTVMPGPSTISVSGLTNYLFSGAPIGPTDAIVMGSTGSVSFLYASVGDTGYPISQTPPSDSGTYSVIATVAADANFLGATSAPFSFSISNPVVASSDVPVLPPWGMVVFSLGILGMGRKAFRGKE